MHSSSATEIRAAFACRLRSITAAALLVAALHHGPALAAADVTGVVLETVQGARAQAGVAALVRRPRLDAVALACARDVARLPHAERLVSETPVENRLVNAGIDDFGAAYEHLALEQGNTDPATGFVSSWFAYAPSWNAATSTDYDAIGLAEVTAADGFRVLVAILVQDIVVPSERGTPADREQAPEVDLAALERATVAAVNAVRLEHGLASLEAREELAAVARAHSNDMARRDYFSHFSPEGQSPRNRVENSGLVFRKMGENIQMSRRERDPVSSAVDSWMNSRGHRETMLVPEYRITGVGAAQGADGAFYFTQLFMLLPDGPASAGRRD